MKEGVTRFQGRYNGGGAGLVAFAEVICENGSGGLMPPSTGSRGRRQPSCCGLAHPGMTVVEPTNPAARTAAVTVASNWPEK